MSKLININKKEKYHIDRMKISNLKLITTKILLDFCLYITKCIKNITQFYNVCVTENKHRQYKINIHYKYVNK